MNTRKVGRLRDLKTDAAPPPELEDRVVQALKSRNLVRSTNRGIAKMKMHYAITATIAVASLLAGLIAGQKYDGAPAETPTAAGNKYALFLYEDASYKQPEAGRMDERVAEYTRWAHEIAAAGKLVAGEKLAEDGLLIAPDGKQASLVPTATQGALTGYFVISANNLDDAKSIAESCPHLRYGGTLSLRRIET